VSPVTPVAASSARALLVKLLGDLSGYTQLPVLRWGRGCLWGAGTSQAKRRSRRVQHLRSGPRPTPAVARPGRPPRPRSDKVLFVPATPADFAAADRWMLVDRSRITFTGTECDKVRPSWRLPDGGPRL
jgi:hypothetical protein